MSETKHFDIEVSRVIDAPPAAVFQAFTDADRFAGWYGPPGFPAARDTVEIDPQVGGTMRFTMVADGNPSLRSGTTGRFTEVEADRILEWTQTWDGVPGQDGPWENLLRVELTDDEDGGTRVVVREGPHAPGTTDMGRQAWEAMLAKLAAALEP
ncbi:MAG TPA: SRPBCC domain-containing protein [Acidimicrobiales bacterium]